MEIARDTVRWSTWQIARRRDRERSRDREKLKKEREGKQKGMEGGR